jgi:hypothetical protein
VLQPIGRKITHQPNRRQIASGVLGGELGIYLPVSGTTAPRRATIIRDFHTLPVFCERLLLPPVCQLAPDGACLKGNAPWTGILTLL